MRVIIVPVDCYKTIKAAIMGLLSSENFNLIVSTALHTHGLFAKGVLIDSDNVFVA
jgi:hypothetical protein